MDKLETLKDIAKNTEDGGFKKAIEEKIKILESNKTVNK